MVGAGSPLTREASGPIPVASRRPTGTRLGTPPGDRPQCYPTEASVILAGDVGGTNTRLAVVEVAGGALRAVVVETFPSRAHRGLEEIATAFVAKAGRPIEHACVGVAGPIRNGRS